MMSKVSSVAALPLECRHACEDPNDPSKDFARHAFDLGRTIVEASGPDEVPLEPWSVIGDFLELLGGISQVDIVAGRYDRSHWLCSRAAQYDDHRTPVVSDYGTNLTRCLLAFNALDEAAVAGGVKGRDGADAQRTAVRVAALLDKAMSHRFLKHYTCCIETLLCNASRWHDGPDLTSIHQSGSSVSPGTGALLAYAVRNHLVHSGFTFPRPNDTVGAETGVLLHAARLALFTTQMLAMTAFERDDVHIERHYRARRVPAGDVLAEIHLHRESDEPE